MIKMILAISKDNAIGHEGKLLWNLRDDMKSFRKYTLHKNVYMGRKTFESIGGLLSDRKNIIITRNENISIENVATYNDLDEFLEMAKDKEEDYICIGGADMYEKSLPYASEIKLTIVDAEFPHADTRANIDLSDFEVTGIESFFDNDQNEYNSLCITYKRK